MYVIKKIYYDNLTGEVIWEASYNYPITPNFDKDYDVVHVLNSRTKDSISLLVLENGAYAQDFAICTGYRVNPETKELEFSYPDPNEPEEPPVYHKPLSVEVNELKQENTLLKAQMQANNDMMDFHEELIVELAMEFYQ